jgi:hypothetical protein
MLVLKTTQKSLLTLHPEDIKHNPAVLDGAPKWSTSDESVVTLEVAEDGLSATVVATGVVGTAQVNVVADSRIGEEVNEIAEVLDVQVLPAEAVSLGISAGAPEEQ